MNRFDRHIVYRLLLGFVGLTAALAVFFVVLHYVEFTDDFFDRGATMRSVFLVYYPNYIPEIVRLISPLALFLTCVHITGRLAQSLQLTALLTNGVSLYRLLKPWLVTGFTVALCMFWLGGWITPRTNHTVLEFEKRYLKEAPRVVDVNNVHRQDRPGTYVTVGYYDQTKDMAHRVSIQHFDEWHALTKRIDAPSMTWSDSLLQWRIRMPVVRTFAGGIETRWVEQRIDTTLGLLPRDLARTERDAESMTLPDAAAYIRTLERSGAGGLGRTKVDNHARFAWPAANLILILIGMPLAAVRRRGGQAVQIGLGLLVAFLYLIVQKIAEPFGYTGDLAPVLAAWLPHILFLVAALFLLVNARK